jgi:hypothetical protein
MRLLTRQFLPALFLLAGLHPIPGTACGILPKDKDAERSRQIVEEAKAETFKLKEEADLIFVGFLKKLDFEQETIDTPNGQQVLQHHHALFEASEEIKGQYPKGQALEFTVNKNRIWVSVGCRPQYWQLPKENGAGEMYLVYARDGKVLRTNHIPLDRQAISGYEEAALVRGR